MTQRAKAALESFSPQQHIYDMTQRAEALSTKYDPGSQSGPLLGLVGSSGGSYLIPECGLTCTRHDLPLSPAIWVQKNELMPRLREIQNEIPNVATDQGMNNSGACRSHSPHVHTARDRPHSTKWSRMAPGGASLMCAIFMCVLGRWGAESRRNDRSRVWGPDPEGTVIGHPDAKRPRVACEGGGVCIATSRQRRM